MSQYQSHIKVTLSLSDDTPTEVVKYHITERLSEPFIAEIDFTVADAIFGADGSIRTSGSGGPSWDIADVLDTPAT